MEPPWRRLYKSDREKFDDVFEFDVAGRTMRIEQAYAWASVDTVGLTVWDASLVLAKHLEHTHGPGGLSGRRALELGSGCGVTGIAAAFLGAEAWVTDWELVMPLLTRNAQRNSAASPLPIHAHKLKWGDDVSELGTFDLILGADLLYQTPAIGPLLRTMHALARPDSTVLVSYERHNEVADEFWARVPAYFEVAAVPPGKLHPTYRHPKIEILSLRKKPPE